VQNGSIWRRCARKNAGHLHDRPRPAQANIGGGDFHRKQKVAPVRRRVKPIRASACGVGSELPPVSMAARGARHGSSHPADPDRRRHDCRACLGRTPDSCLVRCTRSHRLAYSLAAAGPAALTHLPPADLDLWRALPRPPRHSVGLPLRLRLVGWLPSARTPAHRRRP